MSYSDNGGFLKGGSINRRKLLVGATAGSFLLGLDGKILPARAAPKRGGQITIGALGGQNDILDPHNYFTRTAFVGVHQIFESLIERDAKFVPQMWLAEEVTYQKADQLTIRVKKDIEFHHGKTLGADDVMFSLRRIVTLPGADAQGLESIDLDRMEKLDDRTVRVHLKYPDVSLPGKFSSNLDFMVPVDFDPQKPIGTGPFKLVSMTPNRKMTFARHENYWRSGEPYLDGLSVVTLTDETARVNALLDGQVDAIEGLPFAQVPIIQGRPDLKVLESETGQWLPFVMRTDVAPFNDVRVRQAMRLIADRPQLIAQGLAGHGRLGNDIFSPYDEHYNSGLPQRHQDLDQAKSLLKAAGQSDLTATMTTSNVYSGLVGLAQVFAQQAASIGVKININEVDPSSYWSNWLTYPLSQDFWTNRTYFATSSLAMTADAKWNETHWKNERWGKLYSEAIATLDEARRKELVHECQKIEYDEGGYLIFGFANFVDAYSAKLGGIEPDVSLALGRYKFRLVHVL